jgi:AcrR family transcriptional regulator
MAVLSRRSDSDSKREANREAIATATLDLLDEGQPFAEISIDRIVRQAGLSRPTFYSYFADKRELVLYLGQALENDVAAVADPWFSGESDSIRPSLEAFLQALRRHHGTLAAIVEASTYDTEVNDFWHGLHHRFRESAARRIREMEPGIDEAHAQARAFALVWMTEKTMTELVAGADLEEGAVLDELTRFWSI